MAKLPVPASDPLLSVLKQSNQLFSGELQAVTVTELMLSIESWVVPIEKMGIVVTVMGALPMESIFWIGGFAIGMV